MEKLFALLAICAGNSPVPVELLTQSPVTRSLMFSLNCVWINGWVNNHEAGYLRRHRSHYDVIIMDWITHNRARVINCCAIPPSYITLTENEMAGIFKCPHSLEIPCDMCVLPWHGSALYTTTTQATHGICLYVVVFSCGLKRGGFTRIRQGHFTLAMRCNQVIFFSVSALLC